MKKILKALSIIIILLVLISPQIAFAYNIEQEIELKGKYSRKGEQITCWAYCYSGYQKGRNYILFYSSTTSNVPAYLETKSYLEKRVGGTWIRVDEAPRSYCWQCTYNTSDDISTALGSGTYRVHGKHHVIWDCWPYEQRADTYTSSFYWP
jgi:hypothetical protein